MQPKPMSWDTPLISNYKPRAQIRTVKQLDAEAARQEAADKAYQLAICARSAAMEALADEMREWLDDSSACSSDLKGSEIE